MFMQETPRNLFRTSHLPDGTSSSLPCVDAWDVPKESATEGAIKRRAGYVPRILGLKEPRVTLPSQSFGPFSTVHVIGTLQSAAE